MNEFQIRSELGKGDLKLLLTNLDGYPQDAENVFWTIYTFAGVQISGKDLPATKAKTGEYYAPWFSNVRNGNYKIHWKYQEDWNSPVRHTIQNFYIVDPSVRPQRPGCFENPKLLPEPPAPGGGAYPGGSILGRGDLPLFIKNEDGFPFNAYAVFWKILNDKGCPVTEKTLACNPETGEYFANWHVSTCPGNYQIYWEFMDDCCSPLQSKTMGFAVTKALCTFVTSSITMGPGHCHPKHNVPRTIHLALTYMPSNGTFTAQPFYRIPQGIRNITFYVTYIRGWPGGYPILHILWGNGTEEVQDTLVDTDIVGNPPITAQNLLLQDFFGPIPTTGDPVNFTIYAEIPGGAATARLVAAEMGVPGAPGQISITLTASD